MRCLDHTPASAEELVAMGISLAFCVLFMGLMLYFAYRK